MRTAPSLVPIEHLNALDAAAFERALRPLFERAGPLADALFLARPFASYPALLDAADALARELPDEQKVAILNGHPRIGENADVVREASALAYAEQGFVSEQDATAADLARVYADLARLNAAYEARFGFRFLVFVNGRPKAAIREVLQTRLERSRAAELATALADLVAIARDRLTVLSNAAR